MPARCPTSSSPPPPTRTNAGSCSQTAYQHPGPALVRYPRGTGPGVAIDKQTKTLPIGKGELRRQGQDIALLAFGSRVAAAEQVGERLGLTVANMRFIKPLDELLILATGRPPPVAGHH
jgi:1-deoxy-D-xylulose-5-phosphate synthase